ncbi:MAG: amylo-alpha-1,6-glucosidase, partial [Candidatus Hydrothermarchaeales archaeon]
MIRFDNGTFDYETAKEKEWIVTNGLGGYASSTVIGANTRKYHGLLISSLNPPTDRWLLLSKLEEEATIDGQNYKLSTNKYPGVIHPQGYKYQSAFIYNNFPTFVYQIEGVSLEKTVFMPHGYNATIVSYKVHNKGKPIDIKIRLLINSRDFHSNTHYSSLNWYFGQKAGLRDVFIKASFEEAPTVVLGSDLALYLRNEFWVYDMVYEKERFRGIDDKDDHYSPGEFSIRVGKGKTSFNIIATGGKYAREDFKKLYSKKPKDYEKLLEKERKRVLALQKKAAKLHKCSEDPLVKELTIAADSFIVKRQSTKSQSIIAGYPWFSDWGRDSMISLTGLTLATGRYDDAKEILKTYAKYYDRGIIPNRFSDHGEKPAYNTVDASLWFFIAVYKFLEYTGDYKFVKKELWATLKEVIQNYKEGMVPDIRMDSDGLISSGSKDTQLTWMDAKIGDFAVTPRDGKAVEINALWYNSLRIMEMLAGKYKENTKDYKILAEKAKKSFEKFWNDDKKCLYDVIKGKSKDASVRPNQIFAVSLPYSILDWEKEAFIVKKVMSELSTPYGLRTLSPNDERYKGYYGGDQFNRDSAYHQGTVWPWLLGPFISAYLKITEYSNGSKKIIERDFIRPFLDHLNTAGVGTIS